MGTLARALTTFAQDPTLGLRLGDLPDTPAPLTWIETGTSYGDGARTLATWLGVPGTTIDVHDWGFQDPRCRCCYGDSVHLLPGLLATTTGTLVCWLDAHFPDVYGQTGTARPLATELAALRAWSHQPQHHLWVLIDDARIYGYPTTSGPLPTCHGVPEPLDLRAWTTTHDLTTSPDDEGYLLLAPRP